MSEFAARHVPGRPLFLPNAWDVSSAAALVRAGFTAVGTTSLGVAASHGLPDGQGYGRDETLELMRRLGPLPCLVTVDIEGGFAEDPSAVAELAGELAAAGAVGVNLEDGRAGTTLADPVGVAAIITAVKTRVPDLFVNARIDTYWLPDAISPQWTETVDRAARYHDAGADGIFVPSLVEPARIGELADRYRLNVLYQPTGPTLAELAQLGVARVSTGSLLFRTALGATVDAALSIVDGIPRHGTVPSYDETAPPAGSGR